MKILKYVARGLANLLLLILLADALWIWGPQLTASKRIADVEQFAMATSEIAVDDGVEIIALGEASHGNVEFQELKLSVLQTLVEKEGVRSFALEADFGEGLAINDYIHDGEGSAKDVVNQLSFTIYHTQQMVDLIDWMRRYNEQVDDEEQLSFYGFDMQNPETSLELLTGYNEKHMLVKGDWAKTFEPLKHDDITQTDARAMVAMLEEMAAALKTKSDKEAQLMAQLVVNLKAAINYYQMDFSTLKVNDFRDKAMAANVAWLADFDSAPIMIAGHNGHVGYTAPYYTSMGYHLAKKFGQAYFVIGTDYWQTMVNINEVGKDSGRGNHRFHSADPLAAQAANFDGTYYLDFGQVDEDSETGRIIHSDMSMGSLGEGYSFLMKFLPYTHRIKAVPTELYDAMIFIDQGTPIEPWEK